jgi:hypothetical protein
MRHVSAAIQQLFSSGQLAAVASASRLERLILAAVHLETSST